MKKLLEKLDRIIINSDVDEATKIITMVVGGGFLAWMVLNIILFVLLN